ncbi:MAG: sugar phosphate isomerase/epimerase [Agathobacter sp.]|nr:sugar phosphate isomerase/epimerase [Agathobacter sp.]
MLQIGMQTRNIVYDDNPIQGFELLRNAGFSCADFSLNAYLDNKSLYKGECNKFFDQTEEKLEVFFAPHKEAAKQAGIRIHQMHMPYPILVPKVNSEINDYLWNVVAPKSLKICKFLDCKYIVIHGFKLARYLGSEELEWERTEEFLRFMAPLAKELGIVLCVENLYNSMGSHMAEGPCCDAGKTAERIDRLNEEYGAEVFGFCFDVGHANLVGLDIHEFIKTMGTRLKVLHIHDNDGVSDLHQIPYTFTKTRENKSSTDWEGFVKGLKEIGFQGVLNFEASPVVSAFPEVLKEDVLQFLVKIGNDFANRIQK